MLSLFFGLGTGIEGTLKMPSDFSSSFTAVSPVAEVLAVSLESLLVLSEKIDIMLFYVKKT